MKMVADHRKGSDPYGLRSRRVKMKRGRRSTLSGTKSAGHSIGHSDDEKSERSTKSPSMLTMNSMGSSPSRFRLGRHCQLRFFVEMNGLWTYSVRFESKFCGLELRPMDRDSGCGAVVMQCHNPFAQDMVLINSLLIGIGNEVVLQMDHHRILKRIRNSARPLTLTFYHKSRQASGHRSDGQYLCLWLGSDGTLRFKAKSTT